MGIFWSEPTYFEIFLSYVYHYVILATIFSLLFVYFLFRTRSPLKEIDESDQHEHHSSESKKKSRHRTTSATAVVANGGVEVQEGDEELLKTILHGMNLADAVAADDEDEEGRDGQKVTGARKVIENEEEEEDDDAPPKQRRQIIREVTVRKIFLPADAKYADVENTAKRLIGEAQANSPRKDSDTGGVEFKNAIKNIREASKRLEDEDLISPVQQHNGSLM